MAVTEPQPDVTEFPTPDTRYPTPVLPSRFVKIAQWIAIILFLVLAHRVFIYTPDDAYITYRYSLNVAEGYGPVFNRDAPLSDRTEGYSCPLFMFLLAFL